MRKVRFNRYIPIEYEKLEGRSDRVEGTGRWEKDFPNEGMFHRWGDDYEEFENGPGNFTVAIVELPDGRIETVLPGHLKFES